MVTIYSKVKSSGEGAKETVMKMLEEPEIGRIYQGTVKRNSGFSERLSNFLPGKKGSAIFRNGQSTD